MGHKAVSYLLYLLAVVFTGFLLAAAIFSWRASFISPERGDLWTTLAILLPVILFANFVAGVWWLIRRKWLVALMPLAAILFNMNYISATIRLPDLGGEQESGDIRVATLNVNGFRSLSSRAVTIFGVAEMTRHERIDVLCLQEFLGDKMITPDSIAAYFAGRMPYFVRENGAAIVSRFPILDHRYVGFPDTGNDYLWADLLVGRDTLRLFSVHLQTSGVASLRRRFRKTHNQDAPVEELFAEIGRNSRMRAHQVDHVREALDSSPFPVLVAGDFNDTPSSYTYQRLKGDLTDGFRACGSGYGATFRPMGGLLRIDYILYDDAFRGVQYDILPELLSDHKAVVAELQFRP